VYVEWTKRGVFFVVDVFSYPVGPQSVRKEENKKKRRRRRKKNGHTPVEIVRGKERLICREETM
jgi:hypothetical protein